MMRARTAALTLALVIALSLPALATPGSNQLVSWSALCAAVTATTFTWSAGTPAACAGTPNKIVIMSDFTGNVTHTGTCPAGNPLPTYSGLLTCRGAGATLTSLSWSGSGILIRSSLNGSPPPNYVCTSIGSTSFTIVTSASTAAPTSPSTQLTFTPSSIAAQSGGTGTGVTYSLTNPSATVVISPTALANGSTTPITYSAGGAPAGSWTWTISGLGTNGTCNTSTGAVTPGSREITSGTISWFQ